MEISSEVKKSFFERLKIISTMLMDAVLLVAWVAITWITAKCIDYLELKDLDLQILRVFQWVLGISTLITVLSFIIKDVLTLIINTWRYIQNLRKNGKQ